MDIHIKRSSASCQNKESPDQCHMTVSQAQVPTKQDEDWYWPVEVLYTSAFSTLFDQSLR